MALRVGFLIGRQQIPNCYYFYNDSKELIVNEGYFA
jgi:hypothetical protein